MKTISIRTGKREEFINITDEVQREVKASGVAEGICLLTSMHTTAGLTVNENADPSVARDMQNHLSELVPHDGHYDHAEGNSDSHIKTTLAGPSLNLIVNGGRLVLGTWQGIFFCEFDGPRSRKVAVKVIEG